MGASGELQEMIYARLVAHADVEAQVAGRVYDNAPAGAVYPYLSFGPSDTVPLDAECISSRVETIQIDCWARQNARQRPCKDVVDAVRAALHEYDGTMTGAALVEMRVTGTQVRQDPDGLTAHGIVTVSCIVEEI